MRIIGIIVLTVLTTQAFAQLEGDGWQTISSEVDLSNYLNEDFSKKLNVIKNENQNEDALRLLNIEQTGQRKFKFTDVKGGRSIEYTILKKDGGERMEIKALDGPLKFNGTAYLIYTCTNGGVEHTPPHSCVISKVEEHQQAYGCIF